MAISQKYGLCDITEMKVLSHNDFELDIFGAYKSLIVYEEPY